MSMPEFAMTYVVFWPEHNVLKVGRAWRFNRVHRMTRTGGHIIILARGTDATWEREALRTLRRWFPQAFRNETEATGLLLMGRGWSECFQVDEHHLQLAVDLCIEGFARGNEQGVNDEERPEEDHDTGSGVPRVPASPTRGEDDSARPVAAHGRTRPPASHPGADRRSDLPGRSRDRDGDRAPADARGVRLPGDVLGGRRGVDRTEATAEARRPHCLVELPRPTHSRTFAKLRGCGGSAGEGAGADASRGPGARGGVGRVARGAGAHATSAATSPSGRPAHRMPGSPQWSLRGLREVRDCSPPARQVARSAAIRGPAHEGDGG